MFRQSRLIYLVLVALMILGLSVPVSWGEGQPDTAKMSIQQLADGIRTNLTENPTRSLELAQQLEQRTPATATDVRTILKLIGNTQGELQQKLIDCIDKINNTSLAAVFIAELDNKHPMICAVAAGMCGKLKLSASVPGLINLVKRYGTVDDFADSPAERAGVTAVAALGEIRDERGIPILLEKLGHMNAYEIKALAKFGHRVLPQLFDKVANAEDTMARKAASVAIISVTAPKAIPLLKTEATDKDSKARRYAIIALLNIAPESLNELLKLCERDSDPLLERQLLYHINHSRLKDKKLCPFLIKLLENNPRRDIRQGAVTALGRIGGDQAVAALKKALRDKGKIVRVYAAQALQMLTGQNYDID